jgi:RNA polymerase sigma-70 factor (ECF subfamily)
VSIEAFESVLSGAQAGADWALTILYRDLQPRVLRYLSAREPSEAEDLASDVWLDVAQGIGRFRGDEDGFRAWVFTIARRRLLDLHRRTTVRREKPVPGDLLGGDRGIGDVESEAMASLEADAALAVIAGLPSDQADVILLRVLADLSVADVARIVDKRPGAVRALQHRALRNLARIVSLEAVTE